jgi:hypothetical protein
MASGFAEMVESAVDTEAGRRIHRARPGERGEDGQVSVCSCLGGSGGCCKHTQRQARCGPAVGAANCGSDAATAATALRGRTWFGKEGGAHDVDQMSDTALFCCGWRFLLTRLDGPRAVGGTEMRAGW